MHFRFIRFQHSGAGRGSLDDLIALIGGQMAALGHSSECDDVENVAAGGAQNFFRLEPGTVNIVFEAFHSQEALDVLAGVHAAGAVTICIATEQPTDVAATRGAFNHAQTPQSVARYHAFAHAAPYLHAIWHLVPGADTAAWYGRHGRPAAYLDLGHAAGLAAFLTAAPVTKKYDFGFFGSVTPRRAERLRALSEAAPGTTCRIIGVSDQGVAPWEVRNQAMRECHVGLQLRAYDGAELVSSARCAMMLHLGLPVVGDRHERVEPWGRIVDLAADDDAFVALAVAARADAADRHARQLRAFAEILSPHACVGAAIAATLEGEHRPAWEKRAAVKPALPAWIVAIVEEERARIQALRDAEAPARGAHKEVDA